MNGEIFHYSKKTYVLTQGSKSVGLFTKKWMRKTSQISEILTVRSPFTPLFALLFNDPVEWTTI